MMAIGGTVLMKRAMSFASVHTLIGVFVICILAFVVCGPTVNAIGWFDDDFKSVYGTVLRGVPTLWQLFCEGEMGKFIGHPTSERLLSVPFAGYVGYRLGPVGSHCLLGIMHVVCALMLAQVLRTLQWTIESAVAAAALFVASPWVTQAVFSWSAGTVSIGATFWGMLAVIACVRWLTAVRHRRRWLLTTMSLTLVANLWYELWLALPLLFWGIAVYLRQLDGMSLRDALVPSAKRCWPTIIPSVLWIVLTTMTFTGRHVWLPPQRVALVVLSVQLRVVNWLTSTPWSQALSAETHDAIAHPFAVIFLLILIATGGVLLWSRRPGKVAATPLVASLLLAWTWFMSGRLILVLQGGVDLATRHNYPAAMGFAIGVVTIFDALRRRVDRSFRHVLDGIGVLAICACAAVSGGIGLQYANVWRFEQMTVRQLLPVATAMQPGQALAVLGDPTGGWSESQYFASGNGVWLEALLHLRDRNCTCVVAHQIHRIGGGFRFVHIDSWPVRDTPVSFDRLVLFQWHGAELRQVDPAVFEKFNPDEPAPPPMP